MTGKSKKSNLIFHRQSALPIIAASPTISQAVRTSGIGESTLRRWLEDDHFLDEMTRLRQESANLTRRGGPRTVNDIWRQLKDPEIPPELGNLANLESLLLHDNRLSVEIPPELGNLDKLEVLAISRNQLVGCIPGSLRSPLNMERSNLGGLPFC